METTPKSLRLHIAILGEVNSGKSSFLNFMTGQEVSMTSNVKGTTTDVVEKAQELHPIGPVLWMDTAGFGDETELQNKRMKATLRALEKTDVAFLISKGAETEQKDREIIKLLTERHIPFIRVINQENETDVRVLNGDIYFDVLNLSNRDVVIQTLMTELVKICPEDFLEPSLMLSDLISKQGIVILILPIDEEAPKGRLILPEVLAIRDCLDAHQQILCVQPEEYETALASLKKMPDLVVCDSQVVKFMVEHTPENVPCTTFSILMARMKGDLKTLAKGAEMIEHLKDGDEILISEACSHHALKDDIGTVKIPNLLKKKTGKNLVITHQSGCVLPADLNRYRLIIQCGGCTQNRRAVLSKIAMATAQNVAITNYGVCLSALNGVLKRVLSPFKEIK